MPSQNIPLADWVRGDRVEVSQPISVLDKTVTWRGLYEGPSDRGWVWIARIMLDGLSTEVDPAWCRVIRCHGIKIGDRVEWAEKGKRREGIVLDLIDAQHVSAGSVWPWEADSVVAYSKILKVTPSRHPFITESGNQAREV